MVKKVLLALVLVIVLVGGLVYLKLGQFAAMGEAAQNMVMPPTTVTFAPVEPAQWEQTVDATANVVAVQGVTVAAEVAGRVTEVQFASGALAQADQVLLQLDISSETAQLASAQAAAELAKTDLDRTRKLAKRDLVSEDAVDRAEAQVKETVAQVGVIRALIAKKTIRAPFAGRLGLRQVNLGQILSAGDPIVTLQTLDPVYVDFSVPQKQLSRLAPGMPVRVRADAAPGEQFDGSIVAISPEVVSATRNLRVRAEVSNRGEQLRAGMFAQVEVVLPETRSVLQVPATAVSYATFGDSVFVIDQVADADSGANELVLRQQFVRLGQARGDFVDVLEGLKPGERVVSSGVFKLSSGAKVVIDNTLAPDAKLNPQPEES